MRVINRVFENRVTANAGGSYSLWSWDLSAFTEKHIMVEVETAIYDPLNGDVAILYHVEGLYNDTGKTVTALSTYQNERYSFDQGDSRSNGVTYVQGTGILAETLNVVTSGSRTIKVVSSVKLIAF